MAVKKTKTTAVRKTAKKSATARKTRVVKKTASSTKKTASSTKKTASSTKKTARAGKNSATKPSEQANMDAQNLQAAITRLNTLMEDFKGIVRLYANLTAKERERLISAGVRNYGFIEKANDIGKDNPAFLPSQFEMSDFSQNLLVFDLTRQFYLVAEKLQSLASDSMLLRSNVLYRESLRIYNGLKEQAKGRVPGARDLFDALEPFFKRRKPVESQPTQKQELRRLESVAKGKTDGEILVRNIKPKTTGGVREIIED